MHIRIYKCARSKEIDENISAAIVSDPEEISTKYLPSTNHTHYFYATLLSGFPLNFRSVLSERVTEMERSTE
jgi:hypothetical protein